MRIRRFYSPAIQRLEQRNAPALMLAMSAEPLSYMAGSPAAPIADDLQLTDPQSTPSDRYAAVFRLSSMAAEPCVGCGLATSDNLRTFIADEKSRILQRKQDGDADKYDVPTEAEQSAFACLAHDLFNGNLVASQTAAAALDFEVVEINDIDTNDPDATDQVYYALRDRATESRGWGTFIANPSAMTDALVEVPHPLADSETWRVGAAVFQHSGASGFLMAGAHRLANGTPNGDQYGEADVAHRRNSMFHQVHLAWSGSLAANTTWQIHGFDLDKHVGEEDDEMPTGTAAVLSGGNGLISDEIVQLDSRLDTMLAEEFPGQSPPRSHVYHDNDPRGDVVNVNNNAIEHGSRFINLAATKNVQQQDSRRRGGEFVHTELEQLIRLDQPANDDVNRRGPAAIAIADSILTENRQDRLFFSDTINISGDWDPIDATLTLTVLPGQTATLAEFQQALRSVSYMNVSDVANDATRRIEVSVSDGSETVTADRTISVDVESPNQIVGRHVFYNHSAFDDFDSGLSPNDDLAIDFSKLPLHPGDSAKVANVTSYVRGINGIAIDAQCRESLDDMTLADFDFHVGNDFAPSTWTATTPTEFAIRDMGGGVERISLAWPDGEIIGQWLEVRMKANATTGLTHDDVFYFGNAPGESSGGVGTGVNGNDFVSVRMNATSILNRVDVSNRFDHNRDLRVDALDLLIVRDFATDIANQLVAISDLPMNPNKQHLAREAAELDQLLTTSFKSNRALHQKAIVDARAFPQDPVFDDLTDLVLASYSGK